MKLNETGDIQGDKLLHPNDVAAVGKEQFYVTNDHGSRTSIGMTLENYLTLPRANVLYFDGTMFREAASGLVFANGINVSPDGNHIYVAESTARRVQTFKRDAFSGKLTPENAFAFPSGPDNIDVSDEGAICGSRGTRRCSAWWPTRATPPSRRRPRSSTCACPAAFRNRRSRSMSIPDARSARAASAPPRQEPLHRLDLRSENPGMRSALIFRQFFSCPKTEINFPPRVERLSRGCPIRLPDPGSPFHATY